METQAPIIAFLYDFDKTLCTTDMEDYAFIPSLGYTPAEFWGRANAFGWENRMDGLLAYMYTMIQECAAQNIKLDRAFLAPGQEKQRSVWIIISSLVDMARRLGIEILCEGVETEDQLQKLLVSHCKYGQGYLFSPPMNLDAFDAYVDAHELERK